MCEHKEAERQYLVVFTMECLEGLQRQVITTLLTAGCVCMCHCVIRVPVPPGPVLTITVDTLDLGDLGSGSTLLVVVRKTRLQLHQQPIVTAGLLTGDGLHQMGAVPCASGRLIGYPPLPQLEPCGVAEPGDMFSPVAQL